jgi:hypothetical protein
MKLILLSLLSLASLSQAAHISIVGPCSPEPLLKQEISLKPRTSLGDWTIGALQKNNIPFDGNASGIRSIYNSPVGDAALEVLSDTEMRAYGWCVSVNGEQPDVMPDQVILTDPNSEVVWFYAYTLYDQGQWKDICTPSHLIHSRFICH